MGRKGASVTEAEWLAGDDAGALVWRLAEQAVAAEGRHAGPHRDRKFRLFACACLRLAWRALPATSRAGVEYVETFAEGGDESDWYRQSGRVRSRTKPGVEAYNLFWDGWNLPASVCSVARGTEDHGADAPAQLALLRCVFGNPFRRVVIDPAWLAWGDGMVPALARVAYEERALPSGLLDGARLAVLADALAEAGCADERLLGHLRAPGPHARGCWPLDLLLGRG